jgi:class 3 adenylate cyclase
VIGPDVNLTSRIERLCRDLDRNLIMSEDFVDYLDSPACEIGYFRLRGFSQMQHRSSRESYAAISDHQDSES